MATLTTTDKTPIRITADHYEIAGDTHPDRKYNLHYNHETGRWECDCPDVRHNHNDNCKHRRAVVQHITAQVEASKVQHQATEISEQPSALEQLQAKVAELERKVEELEAGKANKRKPRKQRRTGPLTPEEIKAFEEVEAGAMAAVDRAEAEEREAEADRRQHGKLNGNRGFSMMR